MYSRKNICYTYNNNGNLLSSEKYLDDYESNEKIHTYNRGQLIGYTYSFYIYNGDGLRMSKTVDVTTTSHIWDGTNIAADVTNGTVTKYIRDCEGPTCFKFNGQDKWCLLVDFYSGDGYAAYTSDNISSGIFTKDNSYKSPYNFRHGTVIPISMDEYNRIKEVYNPEVIFNDEAIPGTINVPVESQEDPIIWYNFDNIENGVIPDVSGNENTGALHAGGEYPENQKIGSTLNLDTSGYIALPDNITSNIEDFTISMWINIKERGTGIHDKKLFDFGGKISYIPQGKSSFGYHMYTKFGNSNIVSDTTQLAMDTSNPDNWTQLTIVKSGDKVSMYVNGALDSSGNISDTTQSLGVLDNNTIGANITLNIDEFKLYNRALAPVEVLVRSAEGLDDLSAANMIADGISLSNTTNLTENIELPEYGNIITWSSSDSSVITDEGIITIPESGKAEAVLTASIKIGEQTVTRDFAVSVIGIEEAISADITRESDSVKCIFTVPQGEDEELTGYLAVYSENGTLVRVNATALNEGKTEVTIEDLENEVYECRAFIWNKAQQPVIDRIIN